MNAQDLADMRVEAALQRWPTTAAVFQKRQMACAGCVVAPFYTISEAADVYRIPLSELAADLLAAIADSPDKDSGLNSAE